MRIASLVPSSTEMLFALGLGDDVVAVTHECDYPPEAASLPHITRSVIPEGLTAADIDRAVRERTEAGEAIYELDEYLLAELAPDLIVTQAVCEVCAVSFDDVRAVAERLTSEPEVISLDPTTIGEVLADVPRLARAAGEPEAGDAPGGRGRRAAGRRRRCGGGRSRAHGGRSRVAGPRVRRRPLGAPDDRAGRWASTSSVCPARSRASVEWDEVQASVPSWSWRCPAVTTPTRAAAEAELFADRLAALDARVVAVDAAAYFSRPGPRLVDGVELLGHLLHPTLVARAARRSAGRGVEARVRA